MTDSLASTQLSPHEPEESTLPAHHRSRRWLYVLLVAVAVASLILLGWLPRHNTSKEANANADRQKNTLPIAEVLTVHAASSQQQLTLPGTVIPLATVHIYARATGYLKARYVDIGDKVHKGQLIAAISAPDLDASVLQQQSALQGSRQALSKAQSQQTLAQVTFDRVHTLVQHGVLAQQDDDQALATLRSATDDARAAQSAIHVAEAALQHAAALAGFEQLRSPINGTVTARNVEVGSLIAASGSGEGLIPTPMASQTGGPPTGGAQGNELFQIADTSNLVVFITAPEMDAPFLQTGQPAKLTFSEMPSETFVGTVTRTSDSLSQQTRTLLLEIKVADPEHRLRPGMFASVDLSFRSADPGVLIPGDSILPLAQGQFVAVVENGIVHLKPVHAGRDLGTQVYVTTGLRDGESLVVNPTDAIKEGAHVTTQAAPRGQAK